MEAAAAMEGSDDRCDSWKSNAQRGPRAHAYGMRGTYSDQVSLSDAIDTSPAASGTDNTHERRRNLEAASKKAKIRRAAIADCELIDLELVDIEYAQAQLSGDDQGDLEVVNSSLREDMPALPSVSAFATEGEVILPLVPLPSGLVVNEVTCPTRTPSIASAPLDKEAGPVDYLVKRLMSSKDLPQFSGNYVEWLRFKQVFQLSTELGPYTDKENVARLYKKEAGEAKEAVAGLVMTASDAGRIIKILELRFGNPDNILERLSGKILALPALGSGRVDIVKFATTVDSCVSAIETKGNIGYLHEPRLVHDIIDKITEAMSYPYNRYFNAAPSTQPRLVTISRYLFGETELACMAGTVNADVLKEDVERTLRLLYGLGRRSCAQIHRKTARTYEACVSIARLKVTLRKIRRSS